MRRSEAARAPNYLGTWKYILARGNMTQGGSDDGLRGASTATRRHGDRSSTMRPGICGAAVFGLTANTPGCLAGLDMLYWHRTTSTWMEPGRGGPCRGSGVHGPTPLPLIPRDVRAGIWACKLAGASLRELAVSMAGGENASCGTGTGQPAVTCCIVHSTV